MNLIARYKAKDTSGRKHLVEEFFDEQKGNWLELMDGTPLTQSEDGLFASNQGQTFVELTRD